MSKATIEAKKKQYILKGKEALDAAQAYLHENVEVWDEAHETEWRNMVHAAEVYLTKALTLDELLEAVA